ncbi:hypothetical protein EAN91_28090 [Klebsiella pneumoniae]|nr:hypothetical protein EAN91_28090 [Klebsiella pneumoniae]
MSEKRKSALVGCTRTWALELAQFGISLLMVEEAGRTLETFRNSVEIDKRLSGLQFDIVAVSKIFLTCLIQ